ncbi:putative xyloglucan galactosyltransferase gt17 [Sarracenia purpurea var. burkii]
MAKIERPHLFSFVGAPRTDVHKAAVRDEIIKQCADSTRCNLLKCGGGGGGTSNCHDPKSVLKVMTTSHFCLQAPGDSFTRRSTFDAVVAGCIPVFFSPHTAYSQYAWYFPADPGEYSVFVDGERNGSWRMEAELMKIPAERVERMRRTIIGLIATVTYAHPNSSGYGFRDAVDVALAALSKHVDAIKSPT